MMAKSTEAMPKQAYKFPFSYPQFSTSNFCLGVSLALSLAIFILDMVTPLGYAVGLLYLIPLVLALLNTVSIASFLLAWLYTLLIGIGFVYSPSDGRMTMDLVNRLAVVATIWGVGILIYRHTIATSLTQTAERQAAERMLRDREEQFRLFMDHLPAFAWIKNAAGSYIFINRYFVNTFGLRPDAILGKTDTELFPPDTAEQFVANDRQVWQTNQDRQSIETFRLDNEVRYALASKFLLRDGDHNNPLIGGVAIDMTERERAERALWESEALLRKVLMALPVGVCILDASGRIVHDNPARQAIWCGAGWGGIEEFGKCKGWWADTGMLIADEEWAVARAIRKGETSFNEEIVIECLDGTKKTILNSAIPLVDADQRINGAISIDQDITSRKRIEDGLRESEHRLRTLCEAMPQQIWTATPTGVLDYVNQRVLDYFEIPFEKIVGWQWKYLIHPEDFPQWAARWTRSLETGDPCEMKLRFERASDNTDRWHLVRAVPLRDGDGRIIKWYGSNTDVTRLRESEWFARATLDALGAHIAILDEMGMILAVNQAWRTFARTNNAVIGEVCEGADYLAVCDHASELGDEYAGRIAAGIRAVLNRTRIDFTLEYPCHSPIENRWFVLRVTHFPGEGPIRAVVAHENITDRKQAETQLQMAHTKLRTLAKKLVEAEEDERARLARELHDEFAQILAGLTFSLVRLGKQIQERFESSRVKDLQEEIGSMEALVYEMILNTRRIATGLRPSVLDQLGLIPGLRWLASEFESKTGISCRMSIETELDHRPFNPLQATTIFRITQELLTNVMRHAGASLVTCHLTSSDDNLVLSVHDDGRGIAEEEIANHQSLGLRGIQERVFLLGGEFEIHGLPGEGTFFQVRFPNSYRHTAAGGD